MCVSPEEMTVDQLERHLESWKLAVADETDSYWKNYYESRVEAFEKLLKKKAAAGEMIDGS